jgi:hypothetical protein
MCGPNAFSARTHAAANTTAVTAEVEYASDERRLVRRRVFREACDLKSSFKIVRRCGSGSLAGWSGGSAGRRMTRRRIVEETLIPGAKVTDIARRNGVAANLSHCWHFADVQGPLCVRSCPWRARNSRFRFTPKSRRNSEVVAGPKRANCGSDSSIRSPRRRWQAARGEPKCPAFQQS